jgi:hypothetical protein
MRRQAIAQCTKSHKQHINRERARLVELQYTVDILLLIGVEARAIAGPKAALAQHQPTSTTSTTQSYPSTTSTIQQLPISSATITAT